MLWGRTLIAVLHYQVGVILCVNAIVHLDDIRGGHEFHRLNFLVKKLFLYFIGYLLHISDLLNIMLVKIVTFIATTSPVFSFLPL